MAGCGCGKGKAIQSEPNRVQTKDGQVVSYPTAVEAQRAAERTGGTVLPK